MAALSSVILVNDVFQLITSAVSNPTPGYPQLNIISAAAFGAPVAITRVLARLHVHNFPNNSVAEYAVAVLRASDGSIMGGTVLDAFPGQAITGSETERDWSPHWFRIEPTDSIIVSSFALDGTGSQREMGVFVAVSFAQFNPDGTLAPTPSANVVVTKQKVKN